MTYGVQNQKLSSLREHDVVGVIGTVHAIEEGQILIAFPDPLHGEDTFVPFSESTLRLIRRTVRVGDHVIHPDGREIVVKAIIDDASISFCEPGADTAILKNLDHIQLGLVTYKDQVSQKSFGNKLSSEAHVEQEPSPTDETNEDTSSDETSEETVADVDTGLADDQAAPETSDASAPVADAPLSSDDADDANTAAPAPDDSAHDAATDTAEQTAADEAPAETPAEKPAEPVATAAEAPEAPSAPELTAHQLEADEASRSIEAIRNRQHGEATSVQYPKEPRDA